jgi:hypothetical protein
MTKRSNTAKEAASARAGGGFNRVAGLVRASAEIARTTDRLARIARQQIPIVASALVRGNSEDHGGSRSSPDGDRRGATGSSNQSMSTDAIEAIHGFAARMKAIEAATRVGKTVLPAKVVDRVGLASGSETSISSGAESFREISDRESRWRADTAGRSRGRFAQMIQQSSSGMEALRRMGNSERRSGVGNDSIFAKARVESGVARFEQGSGSAWSSLAGRAKRMLDGVGGLSIGSARGSEGSVGKYLAASRASGWGTSRASMVAPASLSRPEFAEPIGGVYGQESRNAPGSITINSTPTVVINSGEGSGDIERQVIGALRAHRDELFDQFKRESVRRERAEF